MPLKVQFQPRALAVIALAGLVLTGCSPAQGTTAEATPAAVDSEISALVPEAIAKTGTLRVAMDASNPPFEFVSEEDGKTMVGLDPDLARAMGALMGLKVEFVQTSFDGLIPSLQAGTNDVAMNSIGDTKAREKIVDFVTYYHNSTMALVEKGNPKGLKADALCGAKVGVVRGSLQQNSMLPAQGEKCRAVGQAAPTDANFAATPESILALTSGQTDAVLADAPTLVVAEKANPNLELAGPAFKNPNPGGVALPKGSELVPAVHAAIKKLMDNGTYDEIIAKYNLSAISIEASVINGATS